MLFFSFPRPAVLGLGNPGSLRHGGSEGVGRVGLPGVLSHFSNAATVTFPGQSSFEGEGTQREG